MIFHFSREGICYLMDGEPYDFFDIDKNYLQSTSKNYPRFEDYCKKMLIWIAVETTLKSYEKLFQL